MPALDGLRAIAVLLVLGFHLLPAVVPHGILGVDVFFVISGFLITTLLVGEIQRTSDLNLYGFTKRRLRRLAPALWVSLLVTVALAAIIGGDALLNVRRQALGAATFSANWVEIFSGTSYFDLTQPLLWTHAWSLAVEAQFYLIWPVILFLGLMLIRSKHSSTYKARNNGYFSLACLALLLSLGSAAWGIYLLLNSADPTRVHMGTDTHAFGLMLGAALALYRYGLKQRGIISTNAWIKNSWWLALLSVLALVLISFADTRWLEHNIPGFSQQWLLILSSILTAILIHNTIPVIGTAENWISKFLTTSVMTWIGNRSYSIYLWHWPLAVLAFYAFPNVKLWISAIGVTALSLICADLSFRFVENPARKLGIRGYLATIFNLNKIKNLSLVPKFGYLFRTSLAAVVVAGAVFGFITQPALSTTEQAIINAQNQAELKRQEQAKSENQAAPDTASKDEQDNLSEDSTPDAPLEPEESTEPDSKPEEPSEPPAEAPNPTEDPIHLEISGEQMVLVGDSVTLASEPAILEAFPGIVLDAEVSRNFYMADDLLAQMDAKYGKREYVIISLATNSDIQVAAVEEFVNQVEADRKIILVTGYGPERSQFIFRTNQAIKEYAANNPARVKLAPWDELIAPHPELLAQDLVHPQPDGSDYYVQAIKIALAEFEE